MQEIADASDVEKKRFSQKAVSREKIFCLNRWHTRLSERASRQERKYEGNSTKGKCANTAQTQDCAYNLLDDAVPAFPQAAVWNAFQE